MVKKSPTAAAPQPAHADIDAADVDLPEVDGFSDGALFYFDAAPVVRDWPVGIKVPIAGGKIVTHRVRMDFRYMDLTGFQDLTEEIGAFVRDGGRLGAAGDPLLQHVLGWAGIGRQGAGALTYDEAAKSELLGRELVRKAVMEALARMCMGIEEKNSETLPGDGPPQPARLNREQRRAAAKALKRVGTA